MHMNAAGQNRPKSVLWKIALIPFGVVIGLSIGWIVLRLWSPVATVPRYISPSDYPALREMLDGADSPRGLYLFDEDIGYRFKPNFTGTRHKSDIFLHKTNSLGLLGGEEVDTDSSAKNVLFLGDSVAYGDGLAYESIFVSQMQDLAGPDYRLANGACPGWSAKQQIGFYEKYLTHLDWDAIVFAVCLNDFVDFRWSWTEEGGYQWMMADSNSTIEVSCMAQLRSQFSGATAALARHDDATLPAWSPDIIESYCQDVLLPFTRRAEHSPVILLLLPTAHQFEALAKGADEEIVGAPQQQLVTFCREHDIPCIDALRLLRESDQVDSAKLYMHDDALHFRNGGHQALAEVAWPQLAGRIGRK